MAPYGVEPYSNWPPTSLMSRLPGPARDALDQVGVVLDLPPGARVLTQGEHSEHAVVLLSGVVKVVHYTHDGVEVLLAIRVGGDLVGEMGALERAPRSATVVACVPTTIRRVDGETFRRFLAAHPAAAVEVTRMVASRLRWANERRADMTAHTAETRIARVLVELARTYGRQTSRGRELGVALTQSEIASMAGVGLATTEKTLRKLAIAGVVRRAYRNVLITDMAELSAVARIGENPY